MTKEERAAAMPYCAEKIEWWRDTEPVAILAIENGQTVRWHADRLSDWPINSQVNRAERSAHEEK